MKTSAQPASLALAPVIPFAVYEEVTPLMPLAPLAEIIPFHAVPTGADSAIAVAISGLAEILPFEDIQSVA